MNKKELYNKILQLDGLTNEEKSELLGLLRKQKKYGLVWEDKPEDVEERLREELPILVEDTAKALISTEADAPNHILIEGDNLEALTALAYTHEGKIDVIYIDPPYNTGNEDFVYNDKFIEKEDEFRHSKWLSFMNKRLRIAKRLLSECGVIFISIDENEIGALRLLGDEIFLPKNFVGQWNWFKSATPPALSKKVKRTIEYILCWQSSGNDDTFRGTQKISKSNDPFTKPQNTFKVLTFPTNSITCAITNGVIPAGVYGTDKFPNEILDDIIVRNSKNSNPVRFKNRFIWIQETLDENIQQNLYIELSKKGVLSYKRSNYNREIPPNFIDTSVGVDTTENAGRNLLEIFNDEKVFDYPKPVSLIKYLINFIERKELVILDFFAGSGTTLHATMELNKDGGHRKCILVTNNENNICEEVTYKRNKRVINGYTTPKGEEVPGLKNNTLRYYRTSFVCRSRSMKNMRQLMSLSTDMLCIKEDLYTEQPKFGEQPTYKNVFRYFDNGHKRMMIIYREEAVQQLVELIQKTDYESKMLVYVFSPSEDPWEGEFEEVQDRVQLCALPQAIYNAYRRILPKKKDEFVGANETKATGQANVTDGTLNFDNEEELQ